MGEDRDGQVDHDRQEDQTDRRIMRDKIIQTDKRIMTGRSIQMDRRS